MKTKRQGKRFLFSSRHFFGPAVTIEIAARAALIRRFPSYTDFYECVVEMENLAVVYSPLLAAFG